jgi:hypothetical protein
MPNGCIEGYPVIAKPPGNTLSNSGRGRIESFSVNLCCDDMHSIKQPVPPMCGFDQGTMSMLFSNPAPYIREILVLDILPFLKEGDSYRSG